MLNPRLLAKDKKKVLRIKKVKSIYALFIEK